MSTHNGHNGHQSSSEIEREVERTRAHMAETLDELRSRMSPGQILDEVLGYAKESGGGRLMSNLGHTVQDNPAPLLLIGAGVAWMMAMSGPRRTGSYSSGRATQRETAGSSRGGDGSADWASGMEAARESARRAGSSMSEGISSAADAAAETAANLQDTVMRSAHDARDATSARMQALRDTAYQTGDAAYRRGRDLGNSLTNMMNDQPPVLGALGLALGAALGAALPDTEAEDRLMGEASDALKEQAGEAAAAGYEKVKAVAEAVVDRTSAEANAQGLTNESAEAVVSDLASKAGSVFEAAKDAALEEASNQGLVDEQTDGSRDSRQDPFRSLSRPAD